MQILDVEQPKSPLNMRLSPRNLPENVIDNEKAVKMAKTMLIQVK